jgi:hypothetical protein
MLFAARIDMLPSLRGWALKMVQIHPLVSLPFHALEMRNAVYHHGPATGQWQFPGSNPERKATSVFC